MKIFAGKKARYHVLVVSGFLLSKKTKIFNNHFSKTLVCQYKTLFRYSSFPDFSFFKPYQSIFDFSEKKAKKINPEGLLLSLYPTAIKLPPRTIN